MMLAVIRKRMKSTDFTDISFGKHLLLSLLLRLFLIVFSLIQDSTANVPFTDIDYKVVTDGARHVLNGDSPYRRHTYRYSPLLAYILVPNLILFESFGKLLFSLFDIFSSILIKFIVYNGLRHSNRDCFESKSKTELPSKKKRSERLPDKFRKWSEIAAYMMLYNPIGMVISARGSNDAVSNLLILLTFYFIQKSSSNSTNFIYAGIFHALAIHFRIFPIIFSLAYYLFVSNINSCFWRPMLYPNKNQLILAITTVLTLISVTYSMYLLYGLEYLHEAYLYHFSRVDIRHNFSLYFLMQYLNSNSDQSLIVKILSFLPRIVIMIYLSVAFGRSRKTLSFCIFALTFTFVTYNTVVTSQYFVWYLSILPLCYPNFRHVTGSFVLLNIGYWIVSQGLWLFSAYLLEFKCWNTFNLIGAQSVFFFIANIFVLNSLILNLRDSIDVK